MVNIVIMLTILSTVDLLLGWFFGWYWCLFWNRCSFNLFVYLDVLAYLFTVYVVTNFFDFCFGPCRTGQERYQYCKYCPKC